MNKTQIKSLLIRMEVNKKAIAKHRDELRNILSEIQSLDESFTEGTESLESAIDSFSQYV